MVTFLKQCLLPETFNFICRVAVYEFIVEGRPTKVKNELGVSVPRITIKDTTYNLLRHLKRYKGKRIITSKPDVFVL